jgi:hypothetical protein
LQLLLKKTDRLVNPSWQHTAGFILRTALNIFMRKYSRRGKILDSPTPLLWTGVFIIVFLLLLLFGTFIDVFNDERKYFIKISYFAPSGLFTRGVTGVTRLCYAASRDKVRINPNSVARHHVFIFKNSLLI